MKEFHFFEAAWAEILEHLLKAPDAGKINSDLIRVHIEECITNWLLFAPWGSRFEFREFCEVLQKFRESSQTPVGKFILRTEPDLLTRLMKIESEANAISRWAKVFEGLGGRAFSAVHVAAGQGLHLRFRPASA